MNRDPVAIAAVRAATGRASGTLRVESRRQVVAGDGSSWNVETPPFRGLMAAADPVVLIVAPPGMDELDAPVWVGEIPGKGFVRLDAEASLAAFFAAYPELPCETRARLIAINLGPRGAERVLFEDEEVESLLEELAARVPSEARPLFCRDGANGSWVLEFLGAVLRRSDPHEPYRLTVARWHVELKANPRLFWRREELVTEAVLERYHLEN